MGAQESMSERLIDEPEEITEFRKCDNPTNIIPELPFNRKVTDRKYIFAFVLFIAFFLPFLIYLCVHSHFNKMIQSTDDFETSFKVDANFTTFNIANDLNKSAGKIVSICIFGLSVSVGMIFLFRYFTTVTVWAILVISMLGIFTLTYFMWRISEFYNPEVFKSNYNDRTHYSLQILAYFFTFASLFFIVIVICMVKRIKLVIRLFRESIKVVFGVPLILLEPLVTFLALIIFYLIFLVVLMYICDIRPEYTELNGVTIFSLGYLLIILLWIEQFIGGCHHMVISGTISNYYFTRDKASLSPIGPIYTSFRNLLKFHLGTVALGSLLISLVAIIKALIRSLISNRFVRGILDECCLTPLETFLKYISKNAYIQTAMHGQPFIRSARRAVQLLAANALSVIAINSVGDFVLVMAQLMICLITFLFAKLINDDSVQHYWAVILIGVVVTAVIANCFFTVFETAVDTVFICFCEDMCMNDGVQQHYYMSVNLMQYVNDAKKAYKA